eukprot:10681844-Alexandrium_andersonii.AAC.1
MPRIANSCLEQLEAGTYDCFVPLLLRLCGCSRRPDCAIASRVGGCHSPSCRAPRSACNALPDVASFTKARARHVTGCSWPHRGGSAP